MPIVFGVVHRAAKHVEHASIHVSSMQTAEIVVHLLRLAASQITDLPDLQIPKHLFEPRSDAGNLPQVRGIDGFL